MEFLKQLILRSTRVKCLLTRINRLLWTGFQRKTFTTCVQLYTTYATLAGPHTHTHTHTHSLPQILSEDYENGSATDAGSNSIDIVGVISRSVTAKYSTFCVGSVVYKQFITV